MPGVGNARKDEDRTAVELPTVTIVFLVHNRCEALRTSLRKMTQESDYDATCVDVVVVDNASDDGSADMVASEFPDVRLIRRTVNSGVSGFNDGFSAATGEFVLALDDDCYLPADGLRRAVQVADEQAADLVSFGVTSSFDESFRFERFYRTGLLTFWGCAALIRRRALDALGGYDPEIFVWANELEFTMRFFDQGFRHLHFPEIVAVHMKPAPAGTAEYFRSWQYDMNSRHFAYVAGKLLWPRDALALLFVLVSRHLRTTMREDRAALRGLPHTLRGFARGLRHRRRLRNRNVSRVYRHNFHDFASPLVMARPFRELVVALPREWWGRRRGGSRGQGVSGRFAEWISARPQYYPLEPALLEMTGSEAIGRERRDALAR